jgi:hypothetical protein
MSHGITTHKTGVHFAVTPLDALVDEPLAIRITGLLSGQVVILRAHALDTGNNQWTSSATFIADSKGNIDVAMQKPVKGSYHQVDPMGIFWSMRPEPQKPPIPFLTKGSTSIEIDLTVEVDGEPVATLNANLALPS